MTDYVVNEQCLLLVVAIRGYVKKDEIFVATLYCTCLRGLFSKL